MHFTDRKTNRPDTVRVNFLFLVHVVLLQCSLVFIAVHAISRIKQRGFLFLLLCTNAEKTEGNLLQVMRRYTFLNQSQHKAMKPQLNQRWLRLRKEGYCKGSFSHFSSHWVNLINVGASDLQESESLKHQDSCGHYH